MTDYFIIYKNKSLEIHKDHYTFDNFIYLNKKAKSNITCKIHGDFQQNFDKFFSCQIPCSKCRSDWLKERNKTQKRSVDRIAPYELRGSTEETIQKYYDKLNAECYLEDDIVLEYKTELIDVRKIKLHYNCRSCLKRQKINLTTFMTFGMMPNCRGCKITNKPKSFNDALKDLPKNLLENYVIKEIADAPYRTKKSKVSIVCNMHPESSFIRSLEKFQSGQICPICKYEKAIKEGKFPGGYSDVFFKNYPERKNDKCHVYYFRFKGIYKIGISVDYKTRFCRLKSHFNIYDAEIVQVLETTLYTAFKIEQKILKDFDSFRIYNKKSTEIFRKNILKNLTLESYLQ